MTNIFPSNIARYNLKLANLADNVFKKTGQERKNAQLQLKRYAERYGFDYDELKRLYDKNVNFYQNTVKLNNPNLTEKQLLSKQEEAFKRSVENVATQKTLESIVSKNEDKYFIWLPSSADDPRDSHQQYYGKKYKMTDPPDGIYPTQEYNCQCGMRIVDE